MDETLIFSSTPEDNHTISPPEPDDKLTRQVWHAGRLWSQDAPRPKADSHFCAESILTTSGELHSDIVIVNLLEGNNQDSTAGWLGASSVSHAGAAVNTKKAASCRLQLCQLLTKCQTT